MLNNLKKPAGGPSRKHPPALGDPNMLQNEELIQLLKSMETQRFRTLEEAYELILNNATRFKYSAYGFTVSYDLTQPLPYTITPHRDKLYSEEEHEKTCKLVWSRLTDLDKLEIAKIFHEYHRVKAGYGFIPSKEPDHR